VNWSRGNCLGGISDQYRHVYVMHNWHRLRNSHRYSHWDRHGHWHCVRDNLRHCNRHRDGDLHVDGTGHSLLNNHLVRPRHVDRDGLGHTNSRNNSHGLSNSHGIHLLDGNGHWVGLGDYVWAVHWHGSLLDNVDGHRDGHLLHHVPLHNVGLRNANLMRNRLRLVNWNGNLVGHHLSDGHDNLDSIRDLYLLDNWHCLRDIDSLCLCDFNRIRNIHGYAHADGNRNGPSNLDGLRYFDGNGNVVRTRNFDRHLIWDDNFVGHSHLLCNGHLDLHRNFHWDGVGNID
jgi:hypothetical protein